MTWRVAGDDDDAKLRPQLPRGLQQFESILLRHDDIRDENLDIVLLE